LHGVGPIIYNAAGLNLLSAEAYYQRAIACRKELQLTWLIKDEVLLITTPDEADNHLTTKLLDVTDLVVRRDGHNKTSDDYDTLINAILCTVKPTTWEQVGGPGSVVGASVGRAKILIVSQTREEHEEVAALLAEIREIAKRH
jgi:hypothetical protein